MFLYVIIQDYELFRSYHLLQHKRGGVRIYFRNSFPLKILSIHYLQESISFELQVISKIYKFVSLYLSPSQTSDDFEKFANNFELTLYTLDESNSDLIVVQELIDKTTSEGAKIEFVTSPSGLHQITNKPTHV